MGLIDLATSGGLGSIVGVLGAFGQKFIDLRAKKLEYSYEQSMRKLDIEEASQERSHEIDMADKQMQRAELEGDITVQSLEANAFVESQKNAGKNPLLTYIRASITMYLLIVGTVLSFFVWNKAGGLDSFSTTELTELLDHIVRTIFFLVVTCTTWWFAARDGNLRFRK